VSTCSAREAPCAWYSFSTSLRNLYAVFWLTFSKRITSGTLTRPWSLQALSRALKKTIFTGVRIRHRKLFLEELRFGNQPLTGIFFDTGASTFTLVLLRERLWQKLTGKKGNEKDNHYLEVPAWGEKKVTLVGAKAEGILKLADLEIENPAIYYDSHIPASRIMSLLVRMGIRIFGVNGIIGNAPFYDEYTVILDLLQSRFGFLKSSQA